MSLVSASLACHFGTRAAERLPGESPLPQCLYCQRPLEWHEAFPLFGWFLRPDANTFPCPCSEKRNMWRLPATELAGFILGLIAVGFAGVHWSWTFLPLCLGLGLLPAIASIDMAYGLIPDILNFLLGVFALIWLFMSAGDVFLGLVVCAGMLAFSLFLALAYSKLRGREMLGLGDVKFFAAAGLWLPAVMVPWFLIIAGFLGAVIGLAWQKIRGEKEFPFAPALCLSLAGCVLYAIWSQLYF